MPTTPTLQDNELMGEEHVAVSCSPTCGFSKYLGEESILVLNHKKTDSKKSQALSERAASPSNMKYLLHNR